MSNVEDLKFNWIHRLVRKSRTPWASCDFPDHTRICWFLDNEKKQGIYEYRDEYGRTNGFAITSKLQEQLPENINQKYFTPEERCWLFAFFFDEIKSFIKDYVDETTFLNFTGVTTNIFFSAENMEALLELCEQQA